MQRLFQQCLRQASSTTNNGFSSSLPRRTIFPKNSIFKSSSSSSKPFHHFHSTPSFSSYSFSSKSFLSNSFISSYQLRGLGHLKITNFRVFFRRVSSGFTNTSAASYARSWRSWFNQLSANDVVLGLIIANAGVFLLWKVADFKFMVDNFMISLDNVKQGRIHTLITSAFSHTDTAHIVINMLGLYFFGLNIGRTFGPEFLLKLYLAGAIGGSMFYLVHQAIIVMSSQGRGMFGVDRSKDPGLGASAAVYSVVFLNIFFNPRATIHLWYFIPVPAVLVGIFLIGNDLLKIVKDRNFSGSAHLGGAAVAALAFARVRKGRF